MSNKLSGQKFILHMVPGGTDKSEGGDYENRLRHVEFEGLVN